MQVRNLFVSVKESRQSAASQRMLDWVVQAGASKGDLSRFKEIAPARVTAVSSKFSDGLFAALGSGHVFAYPQTLGRFVHEIWSAQVEASALKVEYAHTP